MVSSPIPDPGPFRAPQGVHLLLAVGIPTVFSLLAVFWTTGQGPGSWALPNAAYTLLLAFWAPWRLRTRQGPFLKFWLWLMLSLLLYGFLVLFWGGVAILWFLVGFLQGQLAAFWAGQLASRARLFHLLEGIPEGLPLEERVRDFQLDADFSQTHQTALTTSLVLIGSAAVGLATISRYGTGGLTAGLLAAFLVLCLLIGVLLRTYRREMVALMYGHRFTWADKMAPLGWSLLLAVLAALAAWAAMSLGGPWFNPLLWVKPPSGALPQPPAEAPLPEVLPLASPGDPRLAVLVALLLRIFRFQTLLTLIDLGIFLAGWTLVGAVIVALIWPLARWFLQGGRQTRGLGKLWWSLLKAQWEAFEKALAQWWAATRVTQTGSRAASAQEWLRSLYSRPVPGRRQPYPQVVEGFLQLVKWAEPLTIYRPGETTRQFLNRVADLLPEHAVELHRVRDLLDQELFGPRGLNTLERRDFLAGVSALTSIPLSPQDSAGVS